MDFVLPHPGSVPAATRAVFGLDRDEFRRVANFPEKIILPEIRHEILAVGGDAEWNPGHLLQKSAVCAARLAKWTWKCSILSCRVKRSAK